MTRKRRRMSSQERQIDDERDREELVEQWNDHAVEDTAAYAGGAAVGMAAGGKGGGVIGALVVGAVVVVAIFAYKMQTENQPQLDDARRAAQQALDVSFQVQAIPGMEEIRAELLPLMYSRDADPRVVRNLTRDLRDLTQRAGTPFTPIGPGNRRPGSGKTMDDIMRDSGAP